MYLKLRVITDSKVDKIEKISEDTFRVHVKVPAENNAANNRVIELLREIYPDTSIRIVNGHHSPSKIISVDIKD